MSGREGLLADARFAFQMLAAICDNPADCTADRMKARDAASRVMLELTRPQPADGGDGWLPIDSAPQGEFHALVQGEVFAAFKYGDMIKAEYCNGPFITEPTHWHPYPSPPNKDSLCDAAIAAQAGEGKDGR